MRRTFLLLEMLLVCILTYAQGSSLDKVERPNNRKINFGIKAGFNSSMFLVSDFKIKDVTIDQIQNNFKLGYFGALFMRFNMNKHFIQPEVSYNISKCEITFDDRINQFVYHAVRPDTRIVEVD